jgi:hypothetical protein
MLRRSLALVLTASALLPAAAGAARREAPVRETPWATVNQCDTLAKPGSVGVRVAVPDDEGAPAQWVRIRMQWFDSSARAWRNLSSADAGWTRLGAGSRSVQGGTTFTFAAPSAGARLVLRGSVEVEWRKGDTVVDSARLRTTAGHEDPTDAHLRTSRASCEIAR